MKRVRRRAALQEESRRARAEGQRIGFVPTMGFLHEGHLALVRRARRENDRVIASIFVNPLQFGPREDYASYPRDPGRDRALLREEGVDLLFEPEVAEFYPDGFATRVHVSGLDARLCGPRRPGHFEGVTTVVAKLLQASAPDLLYLGQKDYQQAVIVTRMARDLDFSVRVRICPTVRERDGLALSSRNVYLTETERAFAPRLYRALRETAAQIQAGSVRTPKAATRRVERALDGGPGGLEYAEALDAGSLEPVSPLRGRIVLALAYRLGRARLIDNVLVSASASVRADERGRAGNRNRKTSRGNAGRSRFA